MMNYIIRRLLYTIPILIGITLITFFFFNVVGGDPVSIMLGKHANAQMIADMRHEMGFDRPLIWQYFDFLKQIVTFDFGRSYASKQLISKMILDGAPVSLCYTSPCRRSPILCLAKIGLPISGGCFPSPASSQAFQR